MTQVRRRWRIAGAVLAAGAVLFAASPAWAHVEIEPESLPKGATATWSFRVPNEEPNADTVQLDVFFPEKFAIPDVLVQQKPGWTFTVKTKHLDQPIKTDDGSFSDVVTQVTWTGGRIAPGGFDLFTVLGGPLPTKANKLVFKAIQTYSDGSVVRWIETPVKGAPEPDDPAPTLLLTKPTKGGH
jgi:uncharacterized protein YcnI